MRKKRKKWKLRREKEKEEEKERGKRGKRDSSVENGLYHAGARLLYQLKKREKEKEGREEVPSSLRGMEEIQCRDIRH